MVAAAAQLASETAAGPWIAAAEGMPPVKVLCLHGINLNMFGKRDPATYGTATLADIDAELQHLAAALNVGIECFQTNFEGEMVEKIHRAHERGEFSAVLINAGAWTHYSYGLRDALAILSIPIIEVHMRMPSAACPCTCPPPHAHATRHTPLALLSQVHMSNIHAREDMAGSSGEQIRHHSVVSPLAKGIVAGFGLESYLLGLRAAVSLVGTGGPGMVQQAKKVSSPFSNLG